MNCHDCHTTIHEDDGFVQMGKNAPPLCGDCGAVAFRKAMRKTKTEETKPCDDCSRPSVQCCGLTDEDDKEIWKCEGCCCGEEEYVCCGCGCEMANEVDYGNNADVADTCCEKCFNLALAADDAN